MSVEMKVTERIEEYLEAIYHLEEQGQELTIKLVSEALQISPPSVSEMFKRLTQEGYLSTSGRGSYLLLKKGWVLGEQVVRRHRLLERLLVDVLHMDWGLAHDEACRLEHGMSGEMEERMDQTLNHPATCPHGHPIPGETGSPLPELTLTEIAKGEEVTIRGIQGEEREFLRYLATLGIYPGTHVRVEEIAPFGGTRLISLGTCRYSLGDEVTRRILVDRG